MRNNGKKVKKTTYSHKIVKILVFGVLDNKEGKNIRIKYLLQSIFCNPEQTLVLVFAPFRVAYRPVLLKNKQ